MNADIAKLYDCVGTGIPNPVPAYLETLGESSKAHELDDIQDFFRDVNGADSPNIDISSMPDSEPDSEPEFVSEITDDWIAGIEGEFI